jgi:hypothetical protein
MQSTAMELESVVITAQGKKKRALLGYAVSETKSTEIEQRLKKECLC